MATNTTLSNNVGAAPSVGIYVSAVGAAFIATFFDHVRNRDLSAVMKTAVAIREICELSTVSTSGQFVAAIFIFCAMAALLVFVYQPKQTKESFLLGLSVLVVAGLTVPPLQSTGTDAKRIVPADRGGAFNMLPISSAYAQQNIPQEERMVWILLEGPGQHHFPETRVMVYSGISGNLIINALVNTIFYVTIPAGKHQIEISHLGYRGVSFEINPSQPVTAYRVPMKGVKIDSLWNFFGPQTVQILEDPTIGKLLEGAISECRQKNSEAAASLFRQTGIPKDKLERESRRLLCL